MNLTLPARHEALTAAFRIAMRRELNLYEHEVLMHLSDDALNALSAAFATDTRTWP